MKRPSTYIGHASALLLFVALAACSKGAEPGGAGGGGAGDAGSSGDSGRSGDGGTSGASGAAPTGGNGGSASAAGGGGGSGFSPTYPTTDGVDGGFATAECDGPSEGLDASASDAADPGDSGARTRDRDCDGVADTCVVTGDCASDDLRAHYLFEGDVRDASGFGNDGLVIDAVGYAPGAVGSALLLGGAGVVHVPHGEGLVFTETLTVEFWVQPRTIPASGARAGLVDDEGRFGLFLMPNGEVRCVAGLASVSGGEIVTEGWTHVACVLDATTLTLWQRGQFAAGVPRGDDLAPPGSAPISIGGNAPAGDPFDGLIDDLRIWSVARTPAQISRSAQTRR